MMDVCVPNVQHVGRLAIRPSVLLAYNNGDDVRFLFGLRDGRVVSPI